MMWKLTRSTSTRPGFTAKQSCPSAAEWCFLAPVNFLEYSGAQLRLKADNRFMVSPEPKAACDLLVARSTFNLRFAKNAYKEIQGATENTILPWPGKGQSGYDSSRPMSIERREILSGGCREASIPNKEVKP